MKHCETWHNTCCLAKYKDACSLCIKPSACGLGWLMSAFMSAACLSRLSSAEDSTDQGFSGTVWKGASHLRRNHLTPSHFQLLPSILPSQTHTVSLHLFFYRLLSRFSPKRESNTNICIVLLYFTMSPLLIILKPETGIVSTALENHQ